MSIIIIIIIIIILFVSFLYQEISSLLDSSQDSGRSQKSGSEDGFDWSSNFQFINPPFPTTIAITPGGPL